MQKKFYVTTPIYYVTAKPHLGSLYSTLLADVSARWHRLRGEAIFFLTGTDEHGQKIAQAAEKAGLSPQAFVDSFIGKYRQIWANYLIEYDYFIRTTEQAHVKAVQQWLSDLIARDEIYKSQYQGWYCTPCETFLTDVTVEPVTCFGCNRSVMFVSEEAYFFRLSKYQTRLLEFYDTHPDFILPRERANEVVRFVEAGLKDLCISRSTISWGIPFPGDSKHVTYVWADALNNYITAVGYGDSARAKEFAQCWPADLQILGKDILRFHAIYWPAFLMASGLEMPKHLLVHGWIKVNDQKMSKSFGNVVDPELLLSEYGADAVRYYLVSQIAVTHDSSFDINNLRQLISADLANSLGNLLNRTLALAFKNHITTIQRPTKLSDTSIVLLDLIRTTVSECSNLMNECFYHRFVAEVNKLVAKTNAYFHGLEPWKLAKTDPEFFIETLWTTCAALEAISILFWPIMPAKMTQLRRQIGSLIPDTGDRLAILQAGQHSTHFKLQEGTTLFAKYDQLDETQINETKAKNMEEKVQTLIEFDDFLKVELIVGQITSCEAVYGSDKLLCMQVDFGHLGQRQIVSGIHKSYSPTDLIGRQGVFVYNLKPRKIMGLESQGMLLSVPHADRLWLLSIDETVVNGIRVG